MYYIEYGGACMSKTKHKKDKVPKITEAEYAAYLSSLRGLTEGETPSVNMEADVSQKANVSIKKG